MNWVSWQLTRRKKLQPWVGLPNILAGEFLVPELLQDAATPAALAEATLAWLGSDAATVQRVVSLERRFAEMHQTLICDTTQRATDAIAQVLS